MKKQCKRRHYALVNPLQHAIEGASYTPEALLDKLRTRELSAIESFRTGKAGLQDWSDVTALLNLTETMALGGVGPEALPACKQAQTALVAAAKRYETTKRMGLTAQGLEAFRELFAFHDAQRSAVPRGDYEKWIKKTADRVRSHAPGVVDVSTQSPVTA